jgi:hypothetical protein
MACCKIRHSASDGGLSDQTDACFGMQTSPELLMALAVMHQSRDYHRLWIASGWGGRCTGLVEQEYIFTMDDVVADTAKAYYSSGSPC